MSDLGLLLDELLLDYVRVAGIFFVGGIALFNFTDFGKEFSIISLSIALILVIAAVIDYFIERDRIAELGFSPRKLIDVLAYIMIGIAFLIAWVIYQVFHTEQTSLSTIVKEIEREVDVTNAQLIASIHETNRELINAIKGLPTGSSLGSNKSLSKPLAASKYSTVLKTLGEQDRMVKIASLAAVS